MSIVSIGVAQGKAKAAEVPFTSILEGPSTFKDRYTVIEQSVTLMKQSFIKIIYFKQRFSQNCQQIQSQAANS